MRGDVTEQSHRIFHRYQSTLTFEQEVTIVNNTLRDLAVSAFACAGLFFGMARDADAKAAWQAHAGGERYDAAKGGMAQTPDGGFITVGEAQSFGGGDYDVFVVKNDVCGNFMWAATYDIGGGGDDHGRRIRLTPDGGYIITGETENLRNCCIRDDAFLMKLKDNGEVEWVKTYGGKGADRGTDVELYYGGEKGYLVSGITNSFGAGNNDGWLIATDLNGTMLWSRVYGGTGDDGFNGLTQTRNGDIVATGYTRSYNANDPVNPPSDLWLMRTNDQGQVAPGWSLHYGGDLEEEGFEVIEVPSLTGVADGDLVACGYTTSLGVKAEAYLIRVNSGGAPIFDHVYGGGHDVGRDEFHDLSLVPNSEEIFAIGRVFKPSNGFGDYDVFFSRVKANLNPLKYKVYGGAEDDEGYAIAADRQQGGFGWAGSTFSYTFGKEDMYLGLAVTIDGETFCKELEPKIADGIPGFKAQKAPTNDPLVWVECDARVEAIFNHGYELLCTTCPPIFGGGNGDLSEQRVPLRNPDTAVRRTYTTADQAPILGR
jgi:hypothetical protein